MTPPTPAEIEHTILALTAARGVGKTICPSDAAKALLPDGTWTRLLPQVRAAAIRLACEGRIVITRKGKPVDPMEFKGVYRLGALDSISREPPPSA